MKAEKISKEKKSHTIQPKQNSQKKQPLAKEYTNWSKPIKKKYIYSATTQRKGTNEINSDDYKFFHDFLVRKAALLIWQQKGSPQNQDKEKQDEDYYKALDIVNKELDNEIKLEAYYIWEKAGKKNDQADTGKSYYEALKKIIANKCLSTTDPSKHPETAGFIIKMEELGCFKQYASEIWEILLKGIAKQEQQNKMAVYKNPKDNGKIIYTSDLDRIRNDNTFYHELGEKISQYLEIETGADNKKKLALWTGGYDLSAYAESQGCKTLETTKFGKVLDSFYLSSNWNLIGPLWNIISETFVEKFVKSQNVNKEVHVYIRAYDPASVLIRQEIDQIYLDSEIPIFWHCIGSQSDASQYQEIDINGDLNVQSQSAPREDECLLRLMKYYEKNSNLKGGKVMKEKFEQVLTLDFLGVKENIALYRYNKKIQKLAYYQWELASCPDGNNSEYYYTAQKKVQEYINIKSMSMEKGIIEQALQIWEAKKSPQNQSKEDKSSDWNIASLIVVCNENDFLKL